MRARSRGRAPIDESDDEVNRFVSFRWTNTIFRHFIEHVELIGISPQYVEKCKFYRHVDSFKAFASLK